MAGANIVALCMADLKAQLRTVPSLNSNGAIEIYTIAEFEKKANKMLFPVVGLWYEGIFPQADKTGTGLASKLNVSVFIIGSQKKFAGIVDDKAEVTKYLDDIRSKLRTTVSPTGHKWRFISEIPSEVGSEAVAYVQRWETNVILT